jgi:hypothetical protein
MRNHWLIFTLVGIVLAVRCDAAQPTPRNATLNYASSDVIAELMQERPAFASLSRHAQAAIYNWLLANCAVGAEDRKATLERVGSSAEFALIEAFRMGPPQALLDQLATETQRTYEGIVASVVTGEDLPFSPSAKEALLALRRDEYVGNTLDITIINYRRASLSGIDLVGSAMSLRWLERTIPKLKDQDLRARAEAVRASLDKRLRSLH